MSIIVICFGTSWNQLFEPDTEDCCQKVLPFCMIMPVHTHLSRQLKFATNWIFRCWSILHVVLIWLILTVTCLVHSEMLWEAAISRVDKKWKKWCMRVLSFNRKHFFLRAYKSLWATELTVMNRTDYIEKWCSCTYYNYIINKKLIADTFRLTLIASVSLAIQLMFFTAVLF